MTSASNAVEQKTASYLTLYKVFFVLMLLFALIGLWSGERALITNSVQGTWAIRFLIIFPWFFAAIGGIRVWQEEKRNRMNRALASNLLMIFGVIVMASYTVLDHFAHAR